MWIVINEKNEILCHDLFEDEEEAWEWAEENFPHLEEHQHLRVIPAKWADA